MKERWALIFSASPCGNSRSGKPTLEKTRKGRPLGFKTIIRPSKEAVKRHVAETKKRIRKLRGAPQVTLIRNLNPVIRGWANYYRTVVSAKVYAECDNVLYYQLVSWAKWRHPYKSMEWIMGKYWRAIDKRKWVFATPQALTIRRHRMTSIICPYAKVKGNASPYDGDLLYWSRRLKSHPMMRGKLARLLHKQHGKCRWCELTFREEDWIEIDHIDGNHENDSPSNQMALHRHCHDEKHTKSVKEWKYAAGINHT
jgi:RNA-directed DNA polymerase